MHPYPPFNFRKQTGNALFLILIAVALFAALGFAVAQSGKGGGSATREQDGLAAARFIQIGAELRTVVQRMTITGTAVNNVRFSTAPDNKVARDTTVTPALFLYCSSGPDCVFAPEGGAYTARYAREAVDPAMVPAGASYDNYLSMADNKGWLGVGQEDAPDIHVYFVAVKPSVCKEINRILGFGAIIPPDRTQAAMGNGVVVTDPKLGSGVTSGCYHHPTGYNIYFQVLYET